MKYVDFFKTEVKYSGDFNEVSVDEWKAKRDAVAYKGDCFLNTSEHSDTSAEKLDGSMWVENTYPCNRIASITWAEIREEEE